MHSKGFKTVLSSINSFSTLLLLNLIWLVMLPFSIVCVTTSQLEAYDYILSDHFLYRFIIKVAFVGSKFQLVFNAILISDRFFLFKIIISQASS
jgi:hypothetical protein